MFGIELNCDYKTPFTGIVSRVASVFFFPLSVFEEFLGNVSWSSLIEEVLGEFPETSGCVSWWSRHGESLVLM